MKGKVFVQTVNILIQASVVQWQDFRLPSNIPVYESRPIQRRKFSRKAQVESFVVFTVHCQKRGNH